MADKLAGAGSGALTGASAGAAFGPWGAAIGAVAGGLIGYFATPEDDPEMEELANEALNIYKTFGPVDLSNPITFQKFQQAGLLSPKFVDAISTAMDKKTEVEENPENKQNQKDTLNALKDMSQTGLTAEDRAAFNQLRNQTAADSEAKINQILQQQQMRGQASGGNALAAQLNSVQGSSQNASAEADRLAAHATQARASALNNFGGMANQMRSQDLQVAMKNSENELERKKFNANNSTARNLQNTNIANQANLFNLNRQQNVSDTNTQMGNQELLRQANAKRQYWQDQMSQSGKIQDSIYHYLGDKKEQEANEAANRQAMFQGGGQLASQLGGKFGGGGGAGGGGGMSGGGGAMSGGQTMSFMAQGGIVPESSDITSAIKNIRNYMHISEKKHRNEENGSVPTDSIKNDKVPVMLSPGEIVIPKSFSHDPDLSKAYINFIHKHKK